jgi:PAS domain S-box-containing protein
VAPGTGKRKKKEGVDTLRSKAEKELASRLAPSPEGVAPENILHELQVHQIELEMQNEALREARLALEESRDKYLDLYEFAPVGYLTLNRDAVIEEVNLTGATLLGVDRHALIGDRFRRLIAPEDREQWDRHFVGVLRSGGKQSCDLQLLKGDGSRFNVRIESLQVERETKDPVVRMAISDITLQKHAEDVIQRLSEERRLLIENVPAMIWYKDTKNNIIRANPAAADAFGAPAEIIEGRSAYELFRDEAEHYYRDDLEIIQSGQPKFNIIQQMPTADGRKIWVRTDKIPLKDAEGTVTRLLVFSVDITEIKRAEDELIRRSDEIEAANEELVASGDELRRNEIRLTASLEEKEALLAEVHHRVKNNLAAFISLLSLDGTHEDTAEGRRLKQDLQNRARSMALIHETLYKSGEFSMVDMGLYLATLTEQLRGSYKGTGATRTIIDADGISLDLARATPCGLIINELITNSFKYAFPPGFDCAVTRQQPPTLRVSFAVKDGMYELVIGDNGIGLPPSFDPKTAKSLGLKLVNFLARHQLRATVDVSTENGTEFSIRFPEKAPGSS